MKGRFGRKARTHNKNIPLLSKLKRALALAPPVLPPAVDYGAALPSWLSMYGNDLLGDCTCAAVYHAIQTWTGNANPPIDTEPDRNAILLYELSCGYNPQDPSTDEGGIEQDVLSYWFNSGVPQGHDGQSRQKLAAFVEIDQRSLENVKTAIFEGGVVYIGFLVPASFDFAPVWSYDPAADNTITDGHAVVLTGYNDASRLFTLISWGLKYQMSYDFFEKFTDEAYLLASSEWVEKTGKTPAGMSLEELEAQMEALRVSDGHSRWRRRKHRRLRKLQDVQP